MRASASFWTLLRRGGGLLPALGLGAAAIGMMFAAQGAWRLEAEYERASRRAEAVILEKFERNRHDTNIEYEPKRDVVYRFRPEGAAEDVRVTERVREALWNRLSVGDRVDVRYLIRDPRESRIAETTDRSIAATAMMVVSGLLGVTALGVFGAAWRRASRLRRLADRGERRMGEVASLPRRRKGGPGKGRLGYRFEDGRGVVRSGRSLAGPAARFDNLKVGDGATIFVDRDDPSIHAWSGDLG